MTIKNAWKITKQSFSDFFDNKILTLSASLAFFTVFSLPGLLIIILWVSKLFFRKEVVEGSLFTKIEGLIGVQAAKTVQEAIQNAVVTDIGNLAAIGGIVALFFGATSVFGEIQDSINGIWKLKAKPKKGHGLLKLVFNRILSFSMIITLGFILLVSLLLTAILDYFHEHFLSKYPDVAVVLVYIVHLLISYIITAFIFAALFKFLPDAKIKWKHVRIGAMVTALLFLVGRFVIGYLLGMNKMTTAYGAAGSIIIVLLWVYYTSIILYFGATFTHAYVINQGARIYPNNYAVWVQQIEVESKESVSKQPEQKTVIEEPDKT